MLKKTDILIIGGGPAGIILAATGKKNYPDKDFMLIRKEEQVLIPNGIPYLFGTLENSEQNTASHDDSLRKQGVKIEVSEVTSIDPEKKVCLTSDDMKISFKKLVLATGSKPVKPENIEGINNKKVFSIPKDKNYLDKMLRKMLDCKQV